MRAAKIEKPHSIHVVQMENPAAPGPGQVLMKVKMTGICGSEYSGMSSRARWLQSERT